jgi:hypothetical protein
LIANIRGRTALTGTKLLLIYSPLNSVFLSDFTSFFSEYYGNCYTFNSGWTAPVEPLTVLRQGRRHGLHLVLNPHPDEQVLWEGATGGVVVVVHPQEAMPFPEDEGIFLSPGRSTSISLLKVRE